MQTISLELLREAKPAGTSIVLFGPDQGFILVNEYLTVGSRPSSWATDEISRDLNVSSACVATLEPGWVLFLSSKGELLGKLTDLRQPEI